MQLSISRLFTAAALSAASLALSGLAANAQNLVLNPGFESGFTNWTSSGVVGAGAYSSFGMTPTAAFGTNFAGFNGGDFAPTGVLSQSFATTVGQAYRVGFTFGNFNQSGGVRTQEVIAAAVNTANSAVINSVTATDINEFDNSFATVMDTNYSFFFTAIGTTTTLRFSDQPASTTISSDGILDNVSVAAVVPESGSLALVLPALGMVGAMVVRRKK